MADNPYDKTCRQLARRYPLAVLFWLLRLAPDEMVFERWLDTRSVPSPWERERTSDTVAFLRDLAAGGLPWAVVLEFQLDPDPLMFGRMLIYLGHLWIAEKPDPEPGDRFSVGAIVVNLRGRGAAGRCHRWDKARLLTHLAPLEFNLEDTEASTLLNEVAAEKVARIVLSLGPLMKGSDDPGMVDRWLTLAAAETDDQIRADLKTYALVLSEAAGRQDIWHPKLKEWNVIKSPIIEEWKDEGRAEGRVEEAAKLLVAILQAKFGSLPEEVQATIGNTTDLETLERWAPLVGTSTTLEQFRKDANL